MNKKEKAIVYGACDIIESVGDKEATCSCFALMQSGIPFNVDLRDRYSDFYDKPGSVRWWSGPAVHERIMALLFFAEAENDV